MTIEIKHTDKHELTSYSTHYGKVVVNPERPIADTFIWVGFEDVEFGKIEADYLSDKTETVTVSIGDEMKRYATENTKRYTMLNFKDKAEALKVFNKAVRELRKLEDREADNGN